MMKNEKAHKRAVVQAYIYVPLVRKPKWVANLEPVFVPIDLFFCMADV